VKDAIKAVVEIYEDRGEPLPPELQSTAPSTSIHGSASILR
jgi:hypothetical protein